MIRLISSDEFLGEAFAHRWNTLLQASPASDLGQTTAWNQNWWRSFENHGASLKQLFVLVDENNGELVALWPLFVRKRYNIRVVSWIGQAEGMITDYMMPLIPLVGREKAIQTFLEYMAGQTPQWDVVDLSLSHSSGLFPIFAKSAAVYGIRKGLAWSSEVADHCSAIPLPASFDEYLSSLGSTTRSHVKQYIRAAEKQGARLTFLRGQDVLSGLPELFRLNAERWKVFSQASTREFLHNVIKQTPGGDSSLFLISFQLREQVLATALCYENQGICYVHTAGVVRQSPPGLSPGTAMYALLVRSLIENKQSRLDLSPGLEEYKLRLGANVEPIFRFILWHPTSAVNRWRAYRSLLKLKHWFAQVRTRSPTTESRPKARNPNAGDKPSQNAGLQAAIAAPKQPPPQSES